MGRGTIANGVSLNAAFVDGHVRKVTMQDVASDAEPKYFNVVDPAAPATSKPHWDPRYSYDSLP